MGGVNKLLEPLGEEPVVVHVVRAAVDAGAQPVVVVTGNEAERVREALGDAPVEVTHNPLWGEGLSTSLAAGIAALEGRVAGALICLGDMPRVRSEDMRALIRAFRAAESPPDAVVPVHEGRRGNPVLWTGACFGELRALTGDRGARALLERPGARVVTVPAGRGVLLDVDTPEALDRLRASESELAPKTPRRERQR
jgi:molybdenum cofactor cytidylyltransferase